MKKTGAVLVLGGGVLITAGAVYLARRKSVATTDAIERAIAGNGDIDPTTGARGTFNARLTGYWPFTATEGERKMEGGTKDRRGAPLHTLEDALAGKADHVSVSGDDAIFPYGQRLAIDVWPQLVFRVTDTGGHFRGAGKVYRIAGYEPLDICVASSDTKVPKTAVAQIVVGDNFEHGKAVAAGGFKGQTVLTGDVLDGVVEGRTLADREALARAIESELGGRPFEEQIAAAWAMRNRADAHGLTVFGLLAPTGEYGAPQLSKGYASTRREPSQRARAVANVVLDMAPHQDPTGGAIGFWMPSLQERMYQLGGVHRAAKMRGDDTTAQRFARYATYGSEADVREQHARAGLQPFRLIGTVELLGKA